MLSSSRSLSVGCRQLVCGRELTTLALLCVTATLVLLTLRALYDNSPQRAPLHNVIAREEDLVVFNTAVPKTGSITLSTLVYDLCERNGFNVIRISIPGEGFRYNLSIIDQMRLVTNITNWSERKPAYYHGHVAFVDFTWFGVSSKPVYISVVREPLERLISYYYSLHYGALSFDVPKPRTREKLQKNETFDYCVQAQEVDCSETILWTQIPMFCGHTPECWNIGSEWALDRAKFNLVNNYLVVGVTEELGDFIQIIEALLPRYFHGAYKLFNTENRSHLHKTRNRVQPSADVIRKVQDSVAWRMEKEFYEFARERFWRVKHQILGSPGDELQPETSKFVLVNVRP